MLGKMSNSSVETVNSSVKTLQNSSDLHTTAVAYCERSVSKNSALACFDVDVLPDGDVITPPCLTVGVEPVFVCIARNWLGKHPKHRSVVRDGVIVWCSMVQYGAVSDCFVNTQKTDL